MESLTASMANLELSFEGYLKKCTDEYLELNKQEFIKNLDLKEKTLINKIKNFYDNKWTDDERSETSLESYIEKIKICPFLQIHFRKDPTKQSIHEKVQIEWIKKSYPDTVKLPSDKDGLYFENGQLKTCKTKRNNNCSKTIDILIPSKNIYGILKYSTTAGGAQDNQKDDVVFFIKNIVLYLNEKTDYIFYFYLDGAYYTTDIIDALKNDIPEEYSSKIKILSCQKK